MIPLKKRLRCSLDLHKNIKNTFRVLSKGQDIEYEILQLSHRIEKGLCNIDPKEMWGWQKIERLNSLIEELNKRSNSISQVYLIGAKTIISFVENKLKSRFQKDVEKAKNITYRVLRDEKLRLSLADDSTTVSGAMNYDKQIFDEKTPFISVLKTRHSIRTFSDEKIELSRIMDAVNLANCCPSACNRQPYKVYVLSKEERNDLGLSDGVNADKFLIITGIKTAFSMDEYNDWIVGPSIFAGYLSLSLHYYGIANCIMKKNLVTLSNYEKKIIEYFSIPNEEMIVLEIAVGGYLQSNLVPASQRLTNRIIVEKEKN